MSDFVTRLVGRQTGAVTMVQPRTPSMFASTMRRAEAADLPVVDSLSPHDDAASTPAAPVRPGDQGKTLLTQPHQQEGRSPVPGSIATVHPMVRPRQAEAAPVTLAQHAPAIVTQPGRETPPAPGAESVTLHAQMPHEHRGVRAEHIEGSVGAAAVLSAAPVVPPSLVDAHRATGRVSAAAPPSLVSGTVTGRRTESTTRPASTEPPVEVTIGRIEVTAVSAAPDTKQRPGSRRPAMSLEEYLTRRQGGRP